MGTNLKVRNSPEKSGVILDTPSGVKILSLLDRPAGYQLVGKVMAYQGYDV